MSEQPTKEWDKMTQQRRDEILVLNRLFAAVAEVDRTEYRARLARGASYSGLAARLDPDNK